MRRRRVRTIHWWTKLWFWVLPTHEFWSSDPRSARTSITTYKRTATSVWILDVRFVEWPQGHQPNPQL